MDAAGVGKIITISQALFEGMPARTESECYNLTKPLPGGCLCSKDEECISGKLGGGGGAPQMHIFFKI